MDRRASMVAGAATLAVAGTVGTAYVGTGWARALASQASAALNVGPILRTGFGRPIPLPFGAPTGPEADAARILAGSTPTAPKSPLTPRSILANVEPDRESAISASTLQVELSTVPPADSLTTDERNDLQWMRAEENLARDVCLAFFVKWGRGPFATIAASEATHGEAVRQLLIRYAIADPAPGPEGASATDPTFGTMYRDLVKSGSTSYVDALRVAATVEELDIRDLRERRSTRDDVATVYRHLEDGSKVSLLTLVREMERQGVPWVPSYLGLSEAMQIMRRPESPPSK